MRISDWSSDVCSSDLETIIIWVVNPVIAGKKQIVQVNADGIATIAVVPSARCIIAWHPVDPAMRIAVVAPIVAPVVSPVPIPATLVVPAVLDHATVGATVAPFAPVIGAIVSPIPTVIRSEEHKSE